MQLISAQTDSPSKPASPALGRAAQKYALAAVAPFLAAILAVLHPRDPASRNLVWIFVIYYGAVFYIAADSTSDSVRYARWLQDLHAHPLGLGELVRQFFAEGSHYQDVYHPLLTYVVSLFTADHRVLFAAFGVLFGYVYSRNIWFLIDRVPGKVAPLLVFLLVAFAFHKDIGSGLNGARMWTALHVFVFGFLHFTATRHWKYLFVLLAAPLIHFSFWLASAVVAIYFLVRRFGPAVYGFFLLSFAGAVLDLSTVQTLLNYLPLPIEERASGYIGLAERNAEIMVERSGSRVWFLQLNHWLTLAFFAVSTSWMVWRGGLRDRRLVRNLLVFGMLLFGVVNLVSYVPSMGRFYTLAEMLLLAALILFLARRTRWDSIDRPVMAFTSFMLTVNLVLGFRLMLGFTSIWLVAGNFVLAPFGMANESLYEVLLYILRGMR